MSKHNNLPRIPLNLQNPGISKSGPQKNQSYASFQPNVVNRVEYKYQGQDRPNTHMMSIIRRNPDGTLDFQWAKNMVIDAVHSLDCPEDLRPIHRALLTVVFPDKDRGMMAQEADLKTQLSASEKQRVRKMVEDQLKEEENWNAGRGGGSVDGRGKTRDGVP